MTPSMTPTTAPTPIALTLIDDLKRQNTPPALALIPLVEQRMETGIQEYGEPLTVDTDIDPLMYALEEAIDLCKYLRVAIARRTAQEKPTAQLRNRYSHTLETAIALQRLRMDEQE